MADNNPHATLRRSRDAMTRKRAADPSWPSFCLCKDLGDWRRVAVAEQVYSYRCRRCGIAST